MNINNKNKIDAIDVKEINEACEGYVYGIDYDDYDYCGDDCACFINNNEHYDFHKQIAEIVADFIIEAQKLNESIKPSIVKERINAYNDFDKINAALKEDIMFIWPIIQDTQMGIELFSGLFGGKEEADEQ